jgi:hypothetical protein
MKAPHHTRMDTGRYIFYKDCWFPDKLLAAARNIVRCVVTYESRAEVRFLNGAFMKHDEIMDETINSDLNSSVFILLHLDGRRRFYSAEIRRGGFQTRPYIAVGGPYPRDAGKCLIDSKDIGRSHQ